MLIAIKKKTNLFSWRGNLGDLILWGKNLDEEKYRYYDVAVAASITGWVRAFLWRSICASSSVLYCDTDSIFVAGETGITVGSELGQWKKEGDFSEAWIGGKKMYAIKFDGKGYKTASKGANLSVNEIKRVALGETVRHENAAPTFSVKSGVNFVERNIKAT